LELKRRVFLKSLGLITGISLSGSPSKAAKLFEKCIVAPVTVRILNYLLPPDIIAREALRVLRDNLAMGRLVHKDYKNGCSERRGDKVKIRKPVRFRIKS